MEKKIQDYLHLFIGCELMGVLNDEPRRGTLTGIHGEYGAEIQFFLEDDFNVSEEPEYNDYEQVAPILRPLESMTEEEATHLADLYSEWAWRKEFSVTQLAFAGHAAYITIYYRLEGGPHGIGDGEYSEQLIVTADSIWARDSAYTHRYKIVLNVHRMTHYLLSKSFDLFGLIESGLAISSPTKQ